MHLFFRSRTLGRLAAASVSAGLIGLIGAAGQPAIAQEPSKEILARMEKEKEARKTCKIEICKVFAEKKGEGTITCDVTKTWLLSEIQQRILRDKVSWPWGHAQCSAKIDIDRADLAKLVTSPEATIKLKRHNLSCVLDRKPPETGEAYAVKLAIAPEVTFKGSKPDKVVVGWSDIDAPALAKGALWTATATDNTFNVLSGSMVSEINDFMFSHCADAGIKVGDAK